MPTYPTTFPDAAPRPGEVLLAHVRRHPFLVLSAVLHAALLGVLYHVNVDPGRQRIERERERQAIADGERLTERVRLEKRVHDMARIQSLLEQSTAAGSARNLQAATHDENDVQFSALPRTPERLLQEATALSRKIEGFERDTQAERLAKLLGIPKKKALEQIARARKPEPASGIQPADSAQAAAKIEQLEAKARAVLDRRRQQLDQQLSQQQRGMQGAAGHAPIGSTPSASVRQRIDAFTGADLPEQATRAYRGQSMQDIFGYGVGSIPAVDTRGMVKGSGRIIGPGGPHANRVYVDAWYLIGPFEGRHGGAVFSNPHYPPEQGVVLDAVYRGKDGRVLKWDYIDAASYPLIPPIPAEDAVYYGYTELMMDKERDLTIWVGADEDAQLWLNDRLVWQGGNIHKAWFFGQVYDTSNTYARDYNMSEGKRVAHFRKGRNKLFFKLSNGPTRLFFSLVLTP